VAKGGQHTLRTVALPCRECNQDKHGHALKYWCNREKLNYLFIIGRIDDINVILEREHYSMGKMSADGL